MKKLLSVTVEETVLEQIKAEAERQNRTVSNLVETILIESLKET